MRTFGHTIVKVQDAATGRVLLWAGSSANVTLEHEPPFIHVDNQQVPTGDPHRLVITGTFVNLLPPGDCPEMRRFKVKHRTIAGRELLGVHLAAGTRVIFHHGAPAESVYNDSYFARRYPAEEYEITYFDQEH